MYDLVWLLRDYVEVATSGKFKWFKGKREKWTIHLIQFTTFTSSHSREQSMMSKIAKFTFQKKSQYICIIVSVNVNDRCNIIHWGLVNSDNVCFKHVFYEKLPSLKICADTWVDGLKKSWERASKSLSPKYGLSQPLWELFLPIF